MSTGIGFGIALPHASTDLVTDVIGIVGYSKAGIDFNSLDRKPVHTVFLFLVPAGEFQKHINTLANLAKLLHKGDFREALNSAPSGAAVLKLFNEYGFSKSSWLNSHRASA